MSTNFDDYADVALPPEEPTLYEDHDPDDLSDDDDFDDEDEYYGRAHGPGRSPVLDREGIPLDSDGLPPVEILREAMKAVIDPEIGYNVVDLGLVYDIEKQEGGHVQVSMTLTTMGCPLTELIHQQVSVILGSLPGVTSVDVDFVFTPPWTTDMMAEEVREEMRAMGFNV